MPYNNEMKLKKEVVSYVIFVVLLLLGLYLIKQYVTPSPPFSEADKAMNLAGGIFVVGLAMSLLAFIVHAQNSEHYDKRLMEKLNKIERLLEDRLPKPKPKQ